MTDGIQLAIDEHWPDEDEDLGQEPAEVDPVDYEAELRFVTRLKER